MPSCLLCERMDDVVLDGPSNSNVYRGRSCCQHLLCTHCHLHLKKDNITTCPACAFDMSEWQESDLHHADLFNDMDGYDTDDEGYADFGYWLPQPQWEQRLVAVRAQPA